MTSQRRSAFRRTREHQQPPTPSQPGAVPPREPLTTIPLTEKKGRADHRKWEKSHPNSSYYIPDHLLEEAKDTRTEINKIAGENMASTTNIAKVLIEYALKHVRKGEVTLSAQPNPTRRKMAVTLVDADEWPKQKSEVPQQQPAKKHHKVDRAGKPSYLNYRWGADIDRQIEALAGDALSKGEVAIFLLRYALTAYNKGRAKLIAHPIQVKQRVTLSA